MANPNPPEHTRFKKGVSGNPAGTRKLPLDLRKIAEMTADELKRIISKHFRMDKDELELVLNDPRSPTINLIIASTIARAIKEGDVYRAESLFQRSIGRVADAVEIEMPKPVVIQRLDGTIIELGSEDVEEK